MLRPELPMPVFKDEEPVHSQAEKLNSLMTPCNEVLPNLVLGNSEYGNAVTKKIIS